MDVITQSRSTMALGWLALLLVCGCEPTQSSLTPIYEVPVVPTKIPTDAGIDAIIEPYTTDAAVADPVPRLPTPKERGLVEAAVLELRRSLQRDDGQAIGALVHSEGLVFWSHRAEIIPPAVILDRRPSQARPSHALDEFLSFPRTYRKDVVALLGRGLSNVQLEASDQQDACNDQSARHRGAIAAGVLPDTHFANRILSMHAAVGGYEYPEPLRFRTYGLVVYLGIENDKARITHVIQWDPCTVDDAFPLEKDP